MRLMPTPSFFLYLSLLLKIDLPLTQYIETVQPDSSLPFLYSFRFLYSMPGPYASQTATPSKPTPLLSLKKKKNSLHQRKLIPLDPRCFMCVCHSFMSESPQTGFQNQALKNEAESQSLLTFTIGSRFSLCYSPNGCFGKIIGKELNGRLKNL